MTKDELKAHVFQAIDRRREEIIGIGEEIRRHPELGFKEVKTAAVVERRRGVRHPRLPDMSLTHRPLSG